MDATIRVRTVIGVAGAMFAAALATAVLMWAWQAEAAPGDLDATLVPITPCRLIDTRIDFRVGPFESFGPNDTKTIAAHGTNGECTIPTDAVALSLNVTATDATDPSFLTIWPGGDLPNASSLNPGPGQPPTPNAVVTDLSSNGDFWIYNLAGTVQVIVDVNGYYTKQSLLDLHDRVIELESTVSAQQAKIATIESKTAPMSMLTLDGQPTVRFADVNVQVVDGSGDSSGPINGRGNLIVGYNENSSDLRTGSHNLIVGEFHSYSSYGGVVFGSQNAISAAGATVTGGGGNTASGMSASVTGGASNTASGSWASVTGGQGNSASGGVASVTGGLGNTASGGSASATGGRDNIASGTIASVTGGRLNVVNGSYETVVGGDGIPFCIDDTPSSEAKVCGEGDFDVAD